MADYRYLTAAEQAEIVAQERAQIVTPEEIERAREAAHFRAVVRARVGLGEMPDPYVPSDTSSAAAVVQAFDELGTV